MIRQGVHAHNASAFKLKTHKVKMHTVPGEMCIHCRSFVQAAPFDFLRPDEELSQQELDCALAQTALWTAEGSYPLLPYSSIVLEAVAEPPANTTRKANRKAEPQLEQNAR